MIVIAEVDLSECETVDLPSCATKVLIYPCGDMQAPDDWTTRYTEALDAMAKCRLMREGHVFDVEITSSTLIGVIPSEVRWILDPSTGEVVWR